jgi:hypothetical protein
VADPGHSGDSDAVAVDAAALRQSAASQSKQKPTLSALAGSHAVSIALESWAAYPVVAMVESDRLADLHSIADWLFDRRR